MSGEYIAFINPTDREDKADKCDCRLEISDGYGEYSDVYYVFLCDKHRQKKGE